LHTMTYGVDRRNGLEKLITHRSAGCTSAALREASGVAILSIRRISARVDPTQSKTPFLFFALHRRRRQIILKPYRVLHRCGGGESSSVNASTACGMPSHLSCLWRCRRKIVSISAIIPCVQRLYSRAGVIARARRRSSRLPKWVTQNPLARPNSTPAEWNIPAAPALSPEEALKSPHCTGFGSSCVGRAADPDPPPDFDADGRRGSWNASYAERYGQGNGTHQPGVVLRIRTATGAWTRARSTWTASACRYQGIGAWRPRNEPRPLVPRYR
jgi:hypothetical protein